MKISARNQLKGTVSAIAEGAVNGVVSIDLGSTMVKADITMEAINDLGLKEGTDAMAIIKASNVMFAAGSERIQGISARNQIAGTIASVKKGAVNGHVAIETPEGARIMGSITNEAIEDLGLAEGAAALAIVKSTDVIVGFPGEGEADFEDTCRLVEEVGYHQVFTFIYSKREGTPAATLVNDTPHEVVQRRFDRLVEVVQDQAFRANQRDVDTTVDVLVEGASKRDEAIMAGKSPKNQTVHAPLPEGTSIEELAGTTVRVRIDEAKTWYLAGEVAEGSEPTAEAADGR
mgnify:CR=1 FL=1